MTAPRPALAVVVSALTGGDVLDVLSVERRGCLVTSSFSSRKRFRSWSHRTAAGALEALVARGLAPIHWIDITYAPRWWCAWCDGSGIRWHDADACASSCFCLGGVTEAPPSLPALVAVASLGVDALARVEALVAETWLTRVVWRAAGAEEIREHHERTALAVVARLDSYEASMAPHEIFSHEQFRCADGRLSAWPEASPWRAVDSHPGVVAWSALRALAIADDGHATGLHLLDCRKDQVVLGVELL